MKFELRDHVCLFASPKEDGIVIARGESINALPMYFLRYQRADGALVEAWWSEDALQAVAS